MLSFADKRDEEKSKEKGLSFNETRKGKVQHSAESRDWLSEEKSKEKGLSCNEMRKGANLPKCV